MVAIMTDYPDTMTAPTRHRRWVVLAALVVALAGWLVFMLYMPDLDDLRARQAEMTAIVRANPVIAMSAFALIYAVAVALSVPIGTLLSLLAGVLFGTAYGSVIVVLGATVGAAAVFLVARTALGQGLRRRLGPRFQALEAGFNRNGFNYLLFLRLVPLFPFWVVNLAPAFLGMRLAPYLAATAIGITPAAIVYVYTGQTIGLALDGRAEAINPTYITLALCLLAALSLVPVLLGRRKTRTGG